MSVLFVDLIGFTTLSERRDAEEVRELLTRYFDTARQVIGRYGGVVEKFIGDAVMAVWGAPVAHEDDAERTVRAAIDLVAAVASLGTDVGHDRLRARAGVVTGEAAVTMGAVGQGMVAGDAVNTASRIQSAAEPGTVLVDESTRRATERAIVYDDAGVRTLKGRDEPVQVWRADRVVAMVRGGQRGEGLEAPFVGRDRELRLVKDLFHTTVEEGRARLVSISGMAGIGKSRLAWEFEKYIDGVADTIYWHRGRCLSYGEGVTYWALAEMVRSRARIVEGDPPATAAAKLSECLPGFVPDPDERAWVEPRLAHLIGLEDRDGGDRIDLFAAWRVFFERLAEQNPTVLVFEEMQWADSGLVEFIEYLLDWSRQHPVFVLTLTRPEFTERFPSWGAGKRSFHALHLEPLAPSAMDELLTGLVPGLPDELRYRIRERAEGVPLYAVETVRMLLDRGTLRLEGNRYALTGTIGDLAVPETLHALIAARLDAVSVQEREALQTGAVLGQTFTRARLAALMSRDDAGVAPLLDSLVRKELLTVQTNPRSPERGQYEFIQALVQRVAYETLSRRDRKALHLAAARHLEREWANEADEVVEVIAAHYVEAYTASPDDADAAEIRDSARRMLVRAGQRAASLGAAEEALRYYVQAAGLTEDATERAGLLESAAAMAQSAGRLDDAKASLEEALSLHTVAGDTRAVAHVTARLGSLAFFRGESRSGIERLQAAYATLRDHERDAGLGAIAAEIARLWFFLGEPERSEEPIQVALDIAESQDLPVLLCDSLITRGLMAFQRGHRHEAIALVRYARDYALERQLLPQAMRAYFNLVAHYMRADRMADALQIADEGLAISMRRGDRTQEWMFRTTGMDVLYGMGRWDEAEARVADLAVSEHLRTIPIVLAMLLSRSFISIARGDVDAAETLVNTAASLRTSDEEQDRVFALAAFAALNVARGRYVEAIEDALNAIEPLSGEQTVSTEAIVAIREASIALGDLSPARALVARLGSAPAARLARRIRAEIEALRGCVAAADGDAEGAADAFSRAESMFEEIGVPFGLATCRFHHGAWLVGAGRVEEAMEQLELAEQTFTRLRARPWLERSAAVRRSAARATEALAARASAG